MNFRSVSGGATAGCEGGAANVVRDARATGRARERDRGGIYAVNVSSKRDRFEQQVLRSKRPVQLHMLG